MGWFEPLNYVIVGLHPVPKWLGDELLGKGLVLLLGEPVQILLPRVQHLPPAVRVDLKQAKINILKGFFYGIQHCLIRRPSDSTVLEDAGIEHRTVATTALAVRRSNSNHSAWSHHEN